MKNPSNLINPFKSFLNFSLNSYVQYLIYSLQRFVRSISEFDRYRYWRIPGIDILGPLQV